MKPLPLKDKNMTEMIKIQEQLAQLTAKVEALHADSIASKVAMMKNFSLNERHIVRTEFKPAL